MEDTRYTWEKAYLEALEFDTWGQVEEAVEGYQRLQIAAAAEYVENVLELQQVRRDGIGKLAAVLRIRIQELQSGTIGDLGLTGMQVAKTFLRRMIISDAPFPQGILPSKADITSILAAGGTQNSTVADLKVEQGGTHSISAHAAHHGSGQQHQQQRSGSAGGADGTLRGPCTEVQAGDRTLTIHIDSWGLKDATPFVEPRIAVTVRSDTGKLLEAVQETPVAQEQASTALHFGDDVYVQTPLGALPKSAAIFLELRHYKPAKKKKSTKAYCILEMDEIREGPLVLEVYAKPADYKRKRPPVLLTTKPHFLHITLRITKH